MFSSDRSQIRAFFRETWRKYRAGVPLSPLESIVSDVAATHPEYQTLLEDPQAELQGEHALAYGGDNPFLHMGLHIALREQLAANRPPELRPAYQRLLSKYQDAHIAEHQVIECIEQLLMHAAQDGSSADGRQYVECLRRLG